jgi:outer membrane protein assembly factor BamB
MRSSLEKNDYSGNTADIVPGGAALAGTVTPDNVSNANSDFLATPGDAGIVVTDSESGSSGGLADTPWPKYQYDLQNSGQSPYVGSQNSTPKWAVATLSGNAGTYRSSNPVIGPDGTIYAITHYGYLSAINPNGTVNWVRKPVSTYGRMAVALGPDGMIYLGEYKGNLFAIYPGNQTTKWQSTQTGTKFRGAPTVGPDGTIYMGSDKLYAYYPENGTERWSYPAAISKYGCPAIGADGAIYYAGEGNIYALNPDGTLKWSNITGTVQGSPAIGPDGTIYVGSSDSNVYAWNPDGT